MARDPMDHPTFQKTLEAHEEEIFKKKGREPTNFGADTNASEPKVQSWIGSKTSDGYLHTHHDHKSGKITHTWSHTHVAEEQENLDEINYKAILNRYRARAKSKMRADTADNKKKAPAPKKKAVNEEPVEYYDALERKRKAEWHYKRAGKTQGASLSKGIKHDYESELLRRGVKDSNGNQKSLRKEETIDEISKEKRDQYVKKAVTDHGMSNFSKRMSTDKDDKEYYAKRENRRKKGISLALKNESIVDLVLTQDEIEYDAYREEFEGRINAVVDAKKQEMKQGMFDMSEAGFANRFAPLKKTKPDSGYGKDRTGHAAFMSSNPDMRINRRAGLDKDIDWKDDGKRAHAKQQAKEAKFKKIAQQRSGK